MKKNLLKPLCLLLTALCYAFSGTDYGAVSPFLFAWAVALIYCKFGFLQILVIYLGAAMLSRPSVYTAAMVVSNALALMATYYVQKRRGIAVSQSLLLLTSALSNLPILFLASRLNISIFSAGVGILLGVVTAYCAMNCGYAVLIRGAKYRVTKEELASIAIMIVGLFCGIFRIEAGGFSPYYAVATLAALLGASALGAQRGAIFALFLGVGGAIITENAAFLGIFPLCSLAFSLFSKAKRVFPTSAYLLTWTLFSYYLQPFSQPEIILLQCLPGTLLFLLLPKKALAFLTESFGNCYAGDAKATLNRNRLLAARRLGKISEVFIEMSRNVRGSVTQLMPIEENVCYLAESVSRENCVQCPFAYKCYAGGMTPHELFGDVIKYAIKNGKANITELPRQISLNCPKTSQLLACIFHKVISYTNSQMLLEDTANGKIIISEQMREVGILLGELREELKRNVNYDAELEQKIIETLAYSNVICKEAIVYFDERGILRLSLALRKSDVTKKSLLPILEKLLQQKLVKSGDSLLLHEGTVTVELVTKPKYDIVYGYQSAAKREGAVSGDGKTLRRIGADTALIVLGDGMGSGEGAAESSNAAIGMVENFYTAGFESSAVLSLTNRLLTLRNNDTFSAVDICTIDLRGGVADFIKMGTAPSYLLRDNTVETIENKRAPLGIVEDLFPHTERRVLKHGDLLFFMTDGIFDTLGEEGVLRAMNADLSVNPATLAATVFNAAIAAENSAKSGKTSHPYPTDDDKSVLVVRIFQCA